MTAPNDLCRPAAAVRVDTSPVALSVDELRARAVFAEGVAEREWAALGAVSAVVARLAVTVGELPGPLLAETWQRHEAAYTSAKAAADEATAAWMAADEAVSEGNDPHGIVWPVKAVSS